MSDIPEPVDPWSVYVGAVRNCTACPMHQASGGPPLPAVRPLGGQPWCTLIFLAPTARDSGVGALMRSTTPGGVLMRSWLTGAGLDLEHDVMVTSVLKCSDASKFQRRPVPAHVAACSRFRQVEDAAYPPRLIVAVGKYAYQATTGLPYSERSSEVVQVNGQSVFAVESPTWASISATNRNEFFARASYLRRYLIGAGLIQGV